MYPPQAVSTSVLLNTVPTLCLLVPKNIVPQVTRFQLAEEHSKLCQQQISLNSVFRLCTQ